MPSCSTTKSNSKPTSALNCLRLKYHCRISSTSVSAFQTRPTGALKVRSITTASAKSCFMVMVFVQSTGICVWLDNSEHIAGWIFRVSEPAHFRNRHLRHSNLYGALLDLFQCIIQLIYSDRILMSWSVSFQL